MTSPLRRLWRPVLLSLLLTGSVHAQDLGRVAGVVTEAASGRPLVEANVILVGLDRGAVTDAAGRFEIADVPAGPVTVRASSVGYEAADRSLEARAGETVRIRLALAPARGVVGEVVVEGRAASLVGVARSASEGRVGRDQIRLRPLLRVGEVLETIPGTIVTQHSGSGKANQFFLRGFNLDHGTDFAASVEGVPINLPTHAHGQGYLDLNFLIPELVEEVAFEKGPQTAEVGNFATAGSARLRLARRLDGTLVKAGGGTDDYVEALAAGSRDLGGADLLVAGRARYTDGPWVNPENGALFSGVAKLSTGTAADGLTVTALGYHNDWDATDQIPVRAVPETLDRLGTVDPTDGGTTGRYSLATTWTRASTAGRTRATAYGAVYHLDLFSNFTYFLDDPVRGDQFEQRDRRVYGGLEAAHDWQSDLGRGSLTTVGVAARHDEILEVGLYRTSARERIGTVRDDRVRETSGGLYVANETRWTDVLRTVVGLRADVFRFSVASDRDVNSGVETDAILSPKVGVALGPWDGTEVYATAGLGYHSNDARGTVIQVDPATGDPVAPVDPLVRTRGAEVGVRTTALEGLQSTVSLWAIGLDSELVFVGDAGGTEPSDASRHLGLEWANFYRPADWLQLVLDVALTDSRFLDVPGGEARIENSLGRIVTGGVYAGRETGPRVGVQVRHLGPRPLTADGTVEAPASTLVNARAGYRLGAVEVALDVLNLLDSEAQDVSYLYTSRLPGEPAGGVEGVHAHPVIPRTARLSASVRF